MSDTMSDSMIDMFHRMNEPTLEMFHVLNTWHQVDIDNRQSSRFKKLFYALRVLKCKLQYECPESPTGRPTSIKEQIGCLLWTIISTKPRIMDSDKQIIHSPYVSKGFLQLYPFYFYKDDDIKDYKTVERQIIKYINKVNATEVTSFPLYKHFLYGRGDYSAKLDKKDCLDAFHKIHTITKTNYWRYEGFILEKAYALLRRPVENVKRIDATAADRAEPEDCSPHKRAK